MNRGTENRRYVSLLEVYKEKIKMKLIILFHLPFLFQSMNIIGIIGEGLICYASEWTKNLFLIV